MADQTPETPKSKWQGKATAELKGHKSDEIWPLISDFCNLHRWFPHVDTCYLVEGISGEPGLIRYCSSTVESHPSDQTATKWVKEKLIEINQKEKWFKYEIIENNAGFGSYVALWKVIDGGDEDGCLIEWSYVADPVVGLTAEDLVKFVEFTVHAMAMRMHEALVVQQIDKLDE